MKNFYLILFIFCFGLTQAQPTAYNYDKAWKEIDSLMWQKKMARSVLPKIEKVYQKASQEKNWPQRIKAFFYRENVHIQITENKDYEVVILHNFKRQIDSARGAPKAVLQSMLAQHYRDYYYQSRFKVAARTSGENDGDDFRLWSKARFDQEMEKLYKASLAEDSLLKKIPITDWAYLMRRKKKNEYLRPTLYDFLVYQEIDFLAGEHLEKRTPKDTKKLKKLYNDLIAFHTQREDTEAIAYNKLNLLKLTKSTKPKAFEKQWRKLIQEYPDNRYTPYLIHEGVKFYLKKYKDEPKKSSPKKKYYAEQAITYGDKVIRDFPKSEVTKRSKKNIRRLTAPDFSLLMRSSQYPKHAIPIGINYRNLNKLYFKVFPYNASQEKFFDDFYASEREDQKKKVKKLLEDFNPVQDFSLPLKAFDDYESRRTIGKIEGLPQGRYFVIASNHPEFDLDQKNTQIQFLRLISTPYALALQKGRLLLTNRESGEPVAHKKIKVFNTDGTKLLTTLITDKNGQANYSNDDHRPYFQVEGLPIIIGRWSDYRSPKTLTGPRKYLQFFTDRKIYRPGQPLYFKIVAYSSAPEGTQKTIEGKELEIRLTNTNGTEIAKQQLTTNEFGAVSGEFILPPSGLNGEYELSVDKGDWRKNRYTFNVEDYKRPKFKVNLSIKDTIYALNKKATIDGNTMAFSGANINSAKVVYRVVRKPVYYFLPWYLRFLIQDDQQNKKQIAQGETTTDKNGNFTIQFKAISGKFPNKGLINSHNSKNRIFSYKIIAEVTDINGETQTATATVNIGDQNAILRFPMGNSVNLSTLDSIPFRIQNLNGKPVKGKGKLTLIKLKAPNRILRETEFLETDYELYDKTDFIKFFPHLPYANEDQIKNWEKGETILKKEFNARGEGKIPVKTSHWKPGYYVLTASLENQKDTLLQEQLLYCYAPENKLPIDNEFFSAELSKTAYKPGETGKVYFSSAAKNAQVFVQVEANEKIVQSKWISLNARKKVLEFPIKPQYKGKVYIHYYFGKFNTALSQTLVAKINPEQRQLKIKTEVFRNKLKPGEKETWKLTISGKDKDKVWAEVLATMYDASLDQFKSNTIPFNPAPYSSYSRYGSWNPYLGGVFRWPSIGTDLPLFLDTDPLLHFYTFEWFSFKFWYMALFLDYQGPQTLDEVVVKKPQKQGTRSTIKTSADAQTIKKEKDLNSNTTDLKGVTARKDLRETAFFYPNLHTDKEGNIVIKFTAPESLTQWKFMVNAFTKDLKTGYLERKVVTQKKLMVIPNPPRFLREGDSLTLSAKIDNMTDKAMKGKIQLSLSDPIKGDSLDTEFDNIQAKKDFSVVKKGSTNISWKIHVPKNISVVAYKFIAATPDFSDGEESVLPVLTNRKLITETLPIHVKAGETRNFVLKDLQENASKTRTNLRLTLEMTLNPIWQTIFSLPYLKAPKYDNSLSRFGRLYANLISLKILRDNPKIKAVFNSWRAQGELKSKLEQNQELKEILLEETPWIQTAESEREQMERLALLFDTNKIKTELQTTFQQLQKMQLDNGGFPWFDDGSSNLYVTRYLLYNLEHLKELGIATHTLFDGRLEPMVKKMVDFVDEKTVEALDETEEKSKKNFYKTSLFRNYLWSRSGYLKKYPLPQELIDDKNKAVKNLAKEKYELPIYDQAKVVFILEQYGNHQAAVDLLKSLKDRAVRSQEMGMYWRNNQSGWLWQKSPIMTQSLLTLAFDEILKDEQTVEQLKVWLLKNRQTNHWNSAKSTVEAVNVLVSTGKNWKQTTTDGLQLKIGNKPIDLTSGGLNTQAGSGYFKTSWEKGEIKPEMAKISVEKSDPGVAWGALYYQYFEDLDQIKSADNKLKVRKQLYLKKNTEEGVRLQKITEHTPIKIGDRVTVRIALQTDRDMQFVHLKDMHASGLEPINVLSQYKYKGGLGYYESTRDAATHFFFDVMPKGTYVFEYDLRANNVGEFSNGVTTFQNMYTPELSAHSRGVRVHIEQ